MLIENIKYFIKRASQEISLTDEQDNECFDTEGVLMGDIPEEIRKELEEETSES